MSSSSLSSSESTATPKEYFLNALLGHGIKIDPMAFNNPQSPVTCVALKFRTEDELPQMYDRDLLEVMYEGSVEDVKNRIKDEGRVVNAQNKNGETVLMKVCRRTLTTKTKEKGLQVVSLLLKSGANPSVCCDSGKNVLHDVFWTAKPPPSEVLRAMESIVDLLRDHTGKNGILELMLSQDKHGYTPLDYVVPSQQPNWRRVVDRVVAWATEEARNEDEGQGDYSSSSFLEDDNNTKEEAAKEEEAFLDSSRPGRSEMDQIAVAPSRVLELETCERSLVRDVVAEASPDDRRLLLQLCSNSASFLMSDARDPDAIIVAVSPNFVACTGYDASDVIGRNCRFLQGPGTDTRQVELIRRALATSATVSVSLLNYRKTGDTFVNNFLLTPLRRAAGDVAFFLGIQNCPEDVAQDRKRRLLASGHAWIDDLDDFDDGATTIRIPLDDHGYDDDDDVDKKNGNKHAPARKRPRDDDDAQDNNNNNNNNKADERNNKATKRSAPRDAPEARPRRCVIS